MTADPDLVRRILDNLLDNAVRHSPEHGCVRMHADQVEAEWHFEVRDEGPGVDPEIGERIFERFATRGS
jgi:signal transduction histidine kinase